MCLRDKWAHRLNDVSEDRLFVSARRKRDCSGVMHYSALGAQRISKLIGMLMLSSSVPARFTGGSLRMQSASEALDKGFSPETVLARGRWSSYYVFKKFYDRHRRPLAGDHAYVSRILS